MQVTCFINQFTLFHQIYVMDDEGKIIDDGQAVLNDLPDMLIELCEKNDTNVINLGGTHSYIEFVKNNIDKAQVAKYGKNDALIINEV